MHLKPSFRPQSGAPKKTGFLGVAPVRYRSAESGFTVIELMIATLVFSVVLLLVTFGILQISRVYYKGVTETNAQNTARSVVDVLSQAIQFSGATTIQPTTVLAGGGTTPNTNYAFCIGNQRFTYVLGRQIQDSLTPGNFDAYHALVQDTTASCAAPPGIAGNLMTTRIIPGSRELLGKRMRLAKLIVKPVPGTTTLWNIDVKVVYGDDDLLTGTSTPYGPDVSCKTAVQGTQFCAVSELNTVVAKRVE